MSETTAEFEALKRRVHERIGEWIVGHWTQIATFLGGLVTGLLGMYVMFAGEIHDSARASGHAEAIANQLQPLVASLQHTVDQLATRDYVNAQVGPIKQWEADHTALPNNTEAEAAMKLPPHGKRTR